MFRALYWLCRIKKVHLAATHLTKLIVSVMIIEENVGWRFFVKIHARILSIIQNLRLHVNLSNCRCALYFIYKLWRVFFFIRMPFGILLALNRWYKCSFWTFILIYRYQTKLRVSWRWRELFWFLMILLSVLLNRYLNILYNFLSSIRLSSSFRHGHWSSCRHWELPNQKLFKDVLLSFRDT